MVQLGEPEGNENNNILQHILSLLAPTDTWLSLLTPTALGPTYWNLRRSEFRPLLKKGMWLQTNRPRLSNQALIRRTSEWIYRSCILCSIGNDFLED